ncbi:hypothetical protein ACOMHN_065975 [Nucella lapillus]
MSMWADGTVVYYMKAHFVFDRKCGVFMYLGALDLISQYLTCFEIYYSTDFLCELESVSQQQRASEEAYIRMKPVLNQTLPMPYVQCPASHLTHVFLACEVQSECWQLQHSDDKIGGISSMTSWPALLTSLPAMFTCSSDVQSVP